MTAVAWKRAPLRAAIMALGLLGTAASETALVALVPSCHRLDGVWTLQPEKSSLGSGLSFNPYFAITAVELAITTAGERSTQQWRMSGPHLHRITNYAFITDGTRRDTGLKDPMDFEYAAISAEWQNCTLVQTGSSYLFGLEVITTSSYLVSTLGDELTILQYGESPISVVDHRLVFRKAE